MNINLQKTAADEKVHSRWRLFPRTHHTERKILKKIQKFTKKTRFRENSQIHRSLSEKFDATKESKTWFQGGVSAFFFRKKEKIDQNKAEITSKNIDRWNSALKNVQNREFKKRQIIQTYLLKLADFRAFLHPEIALIFQSSLIGAHIL